MWATQEKLYKNAIIQAERDHTLSGGPCDLFFDIHCNPQGASAGSTQIDQLRELHRLQRATMEKPRQDALDAIGKEHYTWVKDHYDPRLMNTRDRMEVHIRRAGEAPEMTSERLERTQREFNE